MTIPQPVRNGASYERVYRAQYAPLVRLAALTTGSVPLAEDLVQDVFVQLYRCWDEVEEPVAWLRRAVVNRCTSWVRRRVLERRHAGRSAPPPLPAVGPDAVAVRTALDRLTRRQRAAVVLRYYADLSTDEIAVALDCRPGAVRVLLHRGLTVMREYLDD